MTIVLRPLRPAALALLMTLVASTCFAQVDLLQSAVEEYSAAVEANSYDEKLQRFSKAVQMFRQAIDDRQQQGLPISAELYVNLGNASLQAELIGDSILAYRRALLIAPNHAQANQNLVYARSLLPQWAQYDEAGFLVETLFFWKKIWSQRQISGAAALCFLLSAVLVAIGIIRRQGLWRGLALIPLAIWLLLLLSNYVGDSQDKRNAVITSSSAILYSSDSENSAPRMSEPLPSGTEIEVIQERDRWSEIRVTNRSGWVRSNLLKSVATN